MSTSLHEHVEEYLRLRQALGFKLQRQGQVLVQYADYLAEHGAVTVTAENAVAWAQLPQGVRPGTWTERLGAARGFAAWLRTDGPAAEVPPAGVFPGQDKRPAPFIFSGDEIIRMHAACGSLRPAFRAATYSALFGLIAVTGIRRSEALSIPAGGIDLDAGLLPVSPAKSRCERVLPLHPTATAALAEYDELRSRRHPSATAFFVTSRGRRICGPAALTAFRQACAIAGIPGQPRIHDLRHSLAVTTLLEWYRSGKDVAAEIPALSAYLGHVNPEGTYWYISAVPELMRLAAERAARKERR